MYSCSNQLEIKQDNSQLDAERARSYSVRPSPRSTICLLRKQYHWEAIVEAFNDSVDQPAQFDFNGKLRSDCKTPVISARSARSHINWSAYSRAFSRESNSMTEMITPLEKSERPTVLALFALHWLLVTIIVVAFSVSAATAAFVTTPVYRATVVALPADSQASMAGLGAALGSLGGGLASLVGLGSAQTQNTVEAVALLQSREFAEEFIRDHDLIPRLITWQWWWSPEPSLYQAYRVFDRKIRRVAEDKKTGLVTLEVDWTNAAEGAQWANELVRRVNESMRRRALAESDASIDLLTNELRAASTIELQGAIARTIESYVKTRALAKVRPDYAFRVIDPGKPAGPRDFIRPNRPLYVIGGFAIGLIVAAFVVVMLDALKRNPRPVFGNAATRHPANR